MIMNHERFNGQKLHIFLSKNRTTGSFWPKLFFGKLCKYSKVKFFVFWARKKIVVLYNSNCLSSYGNCTSYYCSLFVSVLKKALNGEGTQKVSSPFCFLKNATWGNWDELEKLNNSILEFGTYVASISDTSVNLGKNLGIICMFEKHQFVSLQVKLQNKASLENVLKS